MRAMKEGCAKGHSQSVEGSNCRTGVVQNTQWMDFIS